MIVVMEERAAEELVQRVIDRLMEDRFDVHRSTGVLHTVLGGVGGPDTFDTAIVKMMAGVKEVHRVVSPYKLASRAFRPEGTIVKVGAIEIGGNKVVVMAGPCSVENKDQIERSADIVADGGAQIIRGGGVQAAEFSV